MKLQSFIVVLKSKKTKDEKEKYIKEHIKHEYVPLENKQAIAKAIVDACYWVKDGDKTVLHMDSVAKYMLTCMAILELYTDIERQKNGNTLEDFNLLNSYGVFDVIVKNADKKELDEFNMILQLVSDDLISNEYENHAFISNQVSRFAELFGSILEPFLNNIDVEKIKDVIAMAQSGALS